MGVPNINAEPYDARVARQQYFGHIRRTLVQIELNNAAALTQIPEIGQEIAQSKCRVNVFGIEGCENDVRHRASIIQFLTSQNLFSPIAGLNAELRLLY